MVLKISINHDKTFKKVIVFKIYNSIQFIFPLGRKINNFHRTNQASLD